jgi:anti-sigma B factor antagonist
VCENFSDPHPVNFHEVCPLPTKAPAAPLTFDVAHKGDTVVVKLNGKLVAGVNDILHSKVLELIPSSKRIVLDLTDLSRVDSMGLGSLVRVYLSCRSAGVCLELINLGKQVREVLGTANLLSVFAVIGEHGFRLC